MTKQFGRKCSLILANDAGSGIDLSGLRIRFNVHQSVIDTPNTLVARIYNMSDANRQRAEKEFTRVILQAGYEGNYGRIFQGNIVQVRRGRENAIDSYLDLFCGDNDLAHNWGVINTTLAAGYTQSQVYDAIGNSFATYQVKAGTAPELPANGAPRGKVMFGMTRDAARTLASTHHMTWTIEHGELSFLPETDIKPGDTVVINAETGMVGVPQQTQDGVQVSILLNPSIGSGRQIKINNADIASFTRESPVSLQYKATDVPPSLDADGLYKVIRVDHIGDTRGNEWYSNIICYTPRGKIPPFNSRVLLTTTGQ